MKPQTRSLLSLAALVLVVGGLSSWWTARSEAELGAQAAALAKPGDIRMLSSETCSICAAARAWFVANRIAYSECTIERDAACRAAYEAHGSPGTPLMLVRGQADAGFSPTRMRDRLRDLSSPRS